MLSIEDITKLEQENKELRKGWARTWSNVRRLMREHRRLKRKLERIKMAIVVDEKTGRK